ncbi:MAG: hypothetical protein JWO91_2794 [Acidobacteriaceae bacterium]|nr:hypothetical protein [Acidobacteriaceae bacterium]
MHPCVADLYTVLADVLRWLRKLEGIQMGAFADHFYPRFPNETALLLLSLDAFSVAQATLRA